MLIVISLTNKEGEPTCHTLEKNTVTRKGVNGGKTNRVNAYINIREAKTLILTKEFKKLLPRPSHNSLQHS